jgi:hypothetical protein
VTGQQLIGLLLAIGVAAFIWFAFRQGMKVGPDDREDRDLRLVLENDY